MFIIFLVDSGISYLQNQIQHFFRHKKLAMGMGVLTVFLCNDSIRLIYDCRKMQKVVV